MICGAGNEDIVQVKKLAFIYTMAGAKILDVSANVEVVQSAVDGIDLAYSYSKTMHLDIGVRPFIMVSIGMPGDHHVRKSYIDPLTCIKCGLCIPICPTDAIPKDFTKKLDDFIKLGGNLDIDDQSKDIVIKDLCIGCGKCGSICPESDVISYRHNARQLEDLLPKCLEAGAELFELHAAVDEHDITMREWETINRINSSNYNSICLDRLNLGNLMLEHRISEVDKVSHGRFIVQADGYPMSGGEDDYNTTLQAVSCADVVNKKFNMRIDKKRRINSLGKQQISSKKVYKPINDENNIPIVLSGGTNSFSRELSNKCGVRVNGVAIGTFARDLIEEYIQQPDFYNNDDLVIKAYQKAKQLVDINSI